ncbi:MAG: hypothetical protein ACXWUG_25555 [Polyangiales bacterium]
MHASTPALPAPRAPRRQEQSPASHSQRESAGQSALNTQAAPLSTVASLELWAGGAGEEDEQPTNKITGNALRNIRLGSMLLQLSVVTVISRARSHPEMTLFVSISA